MKDIAQALSLKQKFIDIKDQIEKYTDGCVRGMGICKDLNPTERMRVASMADNIIEVFDEHIKKMDD